MLNRVVVFLFVITCLAGCTGETVYAPVTDISSIEPVPQHGVYRVKEDDTLYSIAWRYGLDYRSLAKINHIAKPYHIEMGQTLRLRADAVRVPAALHVQHQQQYQQPRHQHEQQRQQQQYQQHQQPTQPSAQEQKIEHAPTAPVSSWQWPAKGALLATFSELNKGINIRGTKGAPVYASATGVVVYQGDALKAYGNLIIIKHNSVFLSAYAHNQRNLVKEGDWVKAGQQIAEMGDTGTRTVMLHFEIRKSGKPVNPLSYLAR